MIKKGNISVIELPIEIPIAENGKMDKNTIIARGKANARKQENLNNTSTNTYVHVDDIGLDVLLGARGMQHGLVRSEETALAIMKIGDILKNSIAVNELNGSDTRKTDMSYILLGACQSGKSLYVVRSVVSKLQNNVTEIDVYQLSAVKGKKIETPNPALKRGAAVTEQSSLISSESPVISIADFLQSVKDISMINEIFSKDVAEVLKVDRTKGSLSDNLRYSNNERRVSENNGDRGRLKFSLKDSQGNILSEEQQEFFKDSKVRDKDGNLLVVYHGTKSDFTVFDRTKGGESNSIADVGFWFIADEQGALNWADNSWWGDSKKGKTMPVYLKIDNPKIYESTNNNTDPLIEKVRVLHRERAKIANKYLYDIDRVNSITGVSEWDAFHTLVDNPKSADYFLDKISEDKRQKVLSEFDEYKKIETQEETIRKQISELHYTSDGYEKFKADLYKIAGQTSEDANIGGVGKALNNAAETKAKFVESLKNQGYDGVIIHTNFDSNVFGENNTQYLVFDSNQIKNTTNKKPTNSDDIRYSKKDFSSQVDDVLNGADTTSTHLKIMDTPKLLQEAGFSPLPILMTAKHLKNIVASSGKENINYHDLPVEIIKKLPEYISDPVLIADSFTRDDSVVIVTEALDKENRPVMTAIKLDGKGIIDDKYINANIMTSTYGKDNFQSFLNRIAQENAVIYWNKKKSQTMSVNPGIQFPDIITKLDSDTIIRKSKAFVKQNLKNSEKSSSNNGNSEKIDNIRYSLKKITAQTSESERAEILKGKSLKNIPITKNLSSNAVSSWEDINKLIGKEKRHIIKKISEEFDVFKEYFNKDTELTFNFTKNNFRESFGKQKNSYIRFAKMFSDFDLVIENAIGIEVHKREGYKDDSTLKNVYVLISAFEDSENIIPVKLEIKEFIDKPNNLYVAIALDGIKKTEVSKQGTTENGVAQDSRSVNISILDLMKKINPKNTNFTKYFPKSILTSEQIKELELVESKNVDEKTPFDNNNLKETDNTRYSKSITEGINWDQSEGQTNKYVIDDNFLDFVDSVLNMQDINAISKRKFSLGKISQEHAQILNNILHNELNIDIDVSEYSINIDGSAIHHIEERHGANGKHDHSMSKREDIASVGWVANNAENGYIARKQNGKIDYSYKYKNSDGSPSPKIILEKSIENGNKILIAECVPDSNKKQIHIISARKIKSGNDQVLNIESKDSPQPTSKTPLDSNATNNSISEKVENVNQKSENSEKNIDSDENIRYSVKNDSTENDIPINRTFYEKMVDNATQVSSKEEKFAQLIHSIAIKADELRALADRKYAQTHDIPVSVNVLNDDTFKSVIKASSQIFMDGKISPRKVRENINALSKLYNEDNHIFMDYLNELSTESNTDASVLLEPIKNTFDILSEKYDEQTQKFSQEPLSLKELTAIERILRFTKKMYTSYDAIYEDGKRMNLTEEAKKYIDIGERVLKSKKVSPKTIEWVKNKILGYAAFISTPDFVAGHLDGYNDGFYTHYTERFQVNYLKMSRAVIEILQNYDDFLKSHKKYKKRLTKERIAYNGAGSRRILVSEAIDIYLQSTQENARITLVEENGGGFTFTNEYGQCTKETLKFQSKEQIEALYQSFSEEDKEYIKLIKEVYKRCEPLKIEGDEKKFGFSEVIRGKEHYTISRDGRFIDKNIGDARSSMADIPSVNNLKINKKRSKNAHAIPLKAEDIHAKTLEFVRESTMYAYLGEDIRNFSKLFKKNIGDGKNGKFKTLRLLSGELWSKGNKNKAEEYYRKYLDDIQGVRKGDKSDISKWFARIRSGIAQAGLGLNIKVIASQFASYPTALVYLDPDVMLKVMVMKSDRKAMDKYSDAAFVRNHESSVVKAETISDKISKAGSVTTKGINFMDRFTFAKLWDACQLQVAKDSNYAYGTEENQKEAGKLLDKIAKSTQPTYQVTDRSAFQRSENEIVKAFAMFTSVPMKQISLLFSSVDRVLSLRAQKKAGFDVSNTDIKNAYGKTARAVAAIFISNLMYALMCQAVKLLFNKDDEEENDGKNVPQQIISQFIQTNVSMLPGVKEIYDFILNGYDIEETSLSAVNDLALSIKNMFDATKNFASGDGSKQMINSSIKKMVFSISTMLGLPVRNLYNTVYGLTKRTNDKATYWIDNQFYTQSYAKDFEEAIQNEKYDLAETIFNLWVDNSGLNIENKDVLSEMQRLEMVNAKKDEKDKTDYSVFPSSLPGKISIDGEVRELSKDEQNRFKSAYESATADIEKLLNNYRYKKMDDATKSSTIRTIYNYYNETEKSNIAGKTTNRIVLVGKAISIDKLALIKNYAKGVKATNTQSRKTLILKYMNSMNLTFAEKYIMLAYLGYKVSEYEKSIKVYINKLSLTKEQKQEFFEICGF